MCWFWQHKYEEREDNNIDGVKLKGKVVFNQCINCNKIEAGAEGLLFTKKHDALMASGIINDAAESADSCVVKDDGYYHLWCEG